MKLIYNIFIYILLFIGSVILSTIVFNITLILNAFMLRIYIKKNIRIKGEMFFIISDLVEPNKYNIRYHIISFIVGRYICEINNFKKIVENINKFEIINIIIHSKGGHIAENDYILEYIKNKNCLIKTYVIDYACSAATMLFFAGDVLYMSKDAMLGPTDPQINIDGECYSVYALINLFKIKNKNNIDDKIHLEYNDGIKLYYENIKNFKYMIKKHFKNKITKKNKKKVIDLFTDGKISHHTVINYNQIKTYFNIFTYFDDNINKIYKIYKKLE